MQSAVRSSRFKLNDRVRLVSNYFGDDKTNPVWGGECGNTSGCIINFSSDELNIEVKWNTGYKNDYAEHHLDFVAGDWDK